MCLWRLRDRWRRIASVPSGYAVPAAGVVGADRFYLRQYGTGTLKLLTAGGLGIWWLVDLISVLAGRAADRDGHTLTAKRFHRPAAWLLTAEVATLYGQVHETIAPTPPPVVPTWHPVATVTSALFTVTGDHLRLNYSLKDVGFIYLQKAGHDVIADKTDPIVTVTSAVTGQTTVEIAAGTYSLVLCGVS